MNAASKNGQQIDETFRAGMIAGISVVLGFALSVWKDWAFLPGQWNQWDYYVLGLGGLGIILLIASVILLTFKPILRIKLFTCSKWGFYLGMVFILLALIIGSISPDERKPKCQDASLKADALIEILVEKGTINQEEYTKKLKLFRVLRTVK